MRGENTLEQNNMISIIVPIYNKEKYLEKCLDSLLNQTYRELEILLVDDGSTDKSLEICRSYAEKDERIRVFSKKNGGVASARNLGVRESLGEYLSFVDPDDYVHPEYAGCLKEALEESGAELVYCYATDIWASKGKSHTISTETGEITVISRNQYDWFDEKTHAVSWGVLYRQEIAKNILFQDNLKIGEDTLYLAECIHASSKIARVDRALYYYYINDDSVTNGRYSEKKLDELEAWRRVCKVFEDVPEVQRSAKAGYALRCRFVAIKYCKDDKFMAKACDEVGKEFRKVAWELMKKWLQVGRYGTFLKTLYSYYFWNSWIRLKQRRKTYEVEI